MKKIFCLFIFLLGFVFQIKAQELRQVQLLSSEKLKGFGASGLLRVIKPVFLHEGSTLSSDSANFNQDQNTFEAFGNVVITQTNGTIISSDLLNYNGNSRIALLTNNVKMIDNTATLTTNFLTYNMGTKVGTYNDGGKIINQQDTLISKNGYYFANSKDAYFRYNVRVNTPQAIITSDTLKYNSESKIADFYGPTNIRSKTDKSNLYTENGDYNTRTDQARFGKNNLYTDGSKSLKGDSLYYDKNAGYGRAVKNITFIDTAEKVILKGNLAVYRRADESTLVTQNPYVILITQDSAKVDSIWMTADTLFTKVIRMKDFKPVQKEELKSNSKLEDPTSETAESDDNSSSTATSDVPVKPSLAKSKNVDNLPKKLSKRERKREAKKIEEQQTDPVSVAATDSLKTGIAPTLQASDTTKNDSLRTLAKNDSLKTLAADTVKTRIINAFHHVKIFKSDLQAKADSAFYSYADSTIRCFNDPIIWTQGSQMSADTLYLQLKNKKLDNMLLHHNGFIVNTEGDSSKFNQVKGKIITGFFKNNKLNQLYVDGNAETISYNKGEQDSIYSDMNRTVSSRIKILFEENELSDIVFIKKLDGSVYPIGAIPKDKEILKGFIWKPKERPASKEEIIPTLAVATGKVKKAKPAPVEKKVTEKKPISKSSVQKKP